MFVLRALQMFVDALTEDASPKKLAWAVALGFVIGLVPKDNLTAVALMALLCTLRVNLAAGAASAFFFSWLSLLTDPVAHRLGHRLLTAPALESFWTQLYYSPVFPWTAFNNTVVLGSLLMGLALMYPVRLAAEPLAARLLPPLHSRLNQWQATKWLSRAELATKFGSQ
jgi:uncharacterized protein (TIGR03546 family)